ncbi:MAG: hypothetical protein MJA31_14900 [Clostridia bacterium]|nr:hypothetical protein [Clostridia bacterium]
MTDIKNVSTNFWDQEDGYDEEVESADYHRRRRNCNINIFCRRGCRIFIRCGDGGFSVDSECDECQ